jgi:hypothetical protein
MEAIDGWVRDLEDPDSFDDDTLIDWAHYGLTKKPDLAEMLSFTSGELRATATFPGAVRGYWERIAERSGPLLKERGIVLMPLTTEDAHTALELVNAGVITCRALTPQCWGSHHHTIPTPYGSGEQNYGVRNRLVWALDQVQYQTGGDFIETADELRAVLVDALEESDLVFVE